MKSEERGSTFEVMHDNLESIRSELKELMAQAERDANNELMQRLTTVGNLVDQMQL